MKTISAKDLAFELETIYNKDTLYELWYAPIKNFLLANTDKTWNGQSAANITGGTDMTKMPQKINMAFICANFYNNQEAVLDWYQSQAVEDKMVIEKATWQRFINYKELNEIYGQPVIYAEKVDRAKYYTGNFNLIKDKRIKQWYPYIQIRDNWNTFYINDAQKYLEEKNPKLVFPESMRRQLAEALPKPEGYFLKPVTPVAGITFFNVEKDIFRELPLVTTYYVQNKIAYSQKGYPTLPSVRKMTRSLKLTPFPINENDILRTMMIAGLFEGFTMPSISESVLSVLEKLFSCNFEKKPPVPFLLTHLKGINQFYWNDFIGGVTANIFQIFKEMPSEEWITFENIKQFAFTHFISLTPLNSWSIRKLSIDFQVNSPSHYGSQIGDATDDYVCTPYLAGHIFLLAAFGLMELSIDENKPIRFSYYDGLYACKLTALGAYLLGKTTQYTQPHSDSETKLSFDEQSPIIRIEGNIMLGDTMLNDYATKVSDNRYQFSPEKFLKSCKSTKDLENKIVLFKQTINQKLPAFWENYLQQLITNSKEIYGKNNMRIFQLPTENKDLHRIIAQDPELRRIIIKAEGFHVIVEEKKITSFINRMKALGYLIE